MAATANESTSLAEVCENLVNFSIDRDDLNHTMAMLPADEAVSRVTVEYEIPLLKIVSVGWAIAYYMEKRPEKKALLESFWNAIDEFAKSLSEVTNLTTGANVNYFHMIKERVDTYVQALNMQPEAQDPAAVIGPTFAGICNSPDNIHVIMAGNRVFIAAITGVQEYLAHINIT